METILRTQQLCKKYYDKAAVSNVNMTIKSGDIYCFLGQNGAGKTTTMRMIMGLIKPTSGTVELFGTDVSGGMNKAFERIGSIIEYPGFYLNLSGAENLEIHRRFMGMGNKECIDESLKMVGLLEAKNQRVKSYSLGMKQRLGIARALLHHPELLVLDEPTNALDPVGIKEMRQLFISLAKQRGITFLISSHLLAEVEQLATKIGIIDKGKLIEELDSETLRNKTRTCLEIQVTDEQRAAFVIEQELRTKEYRILGKGSLRLYQYLDAPEKVNASLIKNGVSVKGIALSGDNLEDYFLKLTGGEV
ncbi:MAG: ABC transporter ATP-binding protein [Ethanoligenens sp.]